MTKWIQTLGEARDVGQELVAVCHGPECRHRQVIDLDRVIHHIGAGHRLLPVRGIVHYSEKLRCPQCGRRGMFVWLGEPKFPTPVFDEMGHAVNVWDPSGTVLWSTIARSGNSLVARAAYDGARAAYPDRRITLQNGIRVLEDSRWTIIKGGRH